jgi:hypothetical protein
MPRTPVRLLLAWVTLFALYLLFAGQASRAEVCAAALAALVGIGLQLYVRLRSDRTIRLAAPWLTLAGRTGASLGRDTVLVGGALVRAAVGGAVRGRTQSQAFDPGGDAPEAAGRRALVTLAASVAPNGFVWRPASEDGRLLVHRLVPTPPAEDTRWPV